MGGSSGSAGSGGQRSGPRLLLRFYLPGLPADEIYVSRKLTIGRTADNVCVIPEPEVDRHHAVVDFRQGEDGGQFVVRCLQPEGYLDVDGQPVRELVLRPGVRFKVGPAQFECLPAPQVSAAAPARDWSACPGCAGTGCLNLPEGMGQCPDCGCQVVVLSDQGGQRVVLPVEVKPCRLVRLVGQGAMAWVFEARLEGRAEPVAVKILMPHLLADEAALQRFQREIQVLQEVQHPRVLRRLGQGKWKGLPCLLTPLMPGGSLREVIEQNRRSNRMCDFRTAFGWFLDVVEGLLALHAAGLVHRDLKPSNVLLDADWRAVVADLGIARRVGSQTASLTATGETVGTFQYMAPEQLDNPEAVDHRADQYALGVMFYELLTGQLPRGSWRPPSEINPTVPKDFDRLLSQFLQQEPSSRFPSVVAALRALLRSALATPASVRKNVARWPLAAAVLLTAVLLIWFFARLDSLQSRLEGGLAKLDYVCARIERSLPNDHLAPHDDKQQHFPKSTNGKQADALQRGKLLYKSFCEKVDSLSRLEFGKQLPAVLLAYAELENWFKENQEKPMPQELKDAMNKAEQWARWAEEGLKRKKATYLEVTFKPSNLGDNDLEVTAYFTGKPVQLWIAKAEDNPDVGWHVDRISFNCKDQKKFWVKLPPTNFQETSHLRIDIKMVAGLTDILRSHLYGGLIGLALLGRSEHSSVEVPLPDAFVRSPETFVHPVRFVGDQGAIGELHFKCAELTPPRLPKLP